MVMNHSPRRSIICSIQWTSHNADTCISFTYHFDFSFLAVYWLQSLHSLWSDAKAAFPSSSRYPQLHRSLCSPDGITYTSASLWTCYPHIQFILVHHTLSWHHLVSTWSFWYSLLCFWFCFPTCLFRNRSADSALHSKAVGGRLMDKEDKDEQTSPKHGLGWHRTNRKESQVYVAGSAF